MVIRCWRQLLYLLFLIYGKNVILYLQLKSIKFPYHFSSVGVVINNETVIIAVVNVSINS